MSLGYYDWKTIEASSFRITIKSDKSRQMYGFKLIWESEQLGANSTGLVETVVDGEIVVKNCTSDSCGKNKKCDSYTGECICIDSYYAVGDQCQNNIWAQWGEWGECSQNYTHYINQNEGV